MGYFNREERTWILTDGKSKHGIITQVILKKSGKKCFHGVKNGKTNTKLEPCLSIMHGLLNTDYYYTFKTGGKENMTVKEVPYPVRGKKKYSVLHNGKEYTCYVHPFMSKGYTVCTGNGKDETCKDITGTRLAAEIFLHCK